MPPNSTKAPLLDAEGGATEVAVELKTDEEDVCTAASAGGLSATSPEPCPNAAPTTSSDEGKVRGAEDGEKGGAAGVASCIPLAMPRAVAADAASQAGASQTLLPNRGSRPCKAGGSAAVQTRRPRLLVLGLEVKVEVTSIDVHRSLSDTSSPVNPPYTTSTASYPSPPSTSSPATPSVAAAIVDIESWW
jgi:hypothetical protein